jgi:hypothetical protein
MGMLTVFVFVDPDTANQSFGFAMSTAFDCNNQPVWSAGHCTVRLPGVKVVVICGCVRLVTEVTCNEIGLLPVLSVAVIPGGKLPSTKLPVPDRLP